jgi:hypothetical protein
MPGTGIASSGAAGSNVEKSTPSWPDSIASDASGRNSERR